MDTSQTTATVLGAARRIFGSVAWSTAWSIAWSTVWSALGSALAIAARWIYSSHSVSSKLLSKMLRMVNSGALMKVCTRQVCRKGSQQLLTL